MSNITLFNGFPQKGQPHYASEHISITDFLNFVKYGKWKHLIEPIRTEPDKTKRDSFLFFKTVSVNYIIILIFILLPTTFIS